jgi:hypothetical protein
MHVNDPRPFEYRKQEVTSAVKDTGIVEQYMYTIGYVSLHPFVPRQMTGTRGEYGSVGLSTQDIDRTTSSEVDKTMCHPPFST